MLKVCPNCQNEFEDDSKWGPRKFCSRSCSNKRVQTEDVNKRRSDTLKKTKSQSKITCQFCGKEGVKGNGMGTHIKSCYLNPDRVPGTFAGKQHTTKTKKMQAKRRGTGTKVPKSIFDVSSRTQTKILQRLGKGCSNCGWNESSCDIHHIIPRSKGGKDTHDNLTVLCPNCHRLAHTKKLSVFVSLQEQVGEAWREHYYAHE